MSSYTLLVVDDDPAVRETVLSLLETEGIRAECAGSAEEALDRVGDMEYDALLSDIRLPGRSGVEMLGAVRALRPDLPVVLMTGFGSIDSAVEAMRAGAFDYITKPFKRDDVVFAVRRALEHRALEQENRRLRRAVDRTTSLGDLIGRSPAMREIFALLRKVASHRSSVLITGESGTGKEVVARTLHFLGTRAERPFIPVNCTAIPEGLLESELFGHVRGAFTGAHATKRGLFEEAEGGTIFLDEIGDLGLVLQGKLLRVLQDREVRPVGGIQSRRVDVRIVAATNRDLQGLIATGLFRSDLFYRLNVIPVHVPSLRDRPEDVPLLAEAFLRRHSPSATRTLAPAAIDRLERHRWDGNARELENVIERALALTESREIGVEDLERALGAGPERPSPGDGLLQDAVARQLTLRELEEHYIEHVLRATGGNKSAAARILGINRRTLYRRRDPVRQRQPQI